MKVFYLFTYIQYNKEQNRVRCCNGILCVQNHVEIGTQLTFLPLRDLLEQDTKYQLGFRRIKANQFVPVLILCTQYLCCFYMIVSKIFTSFISLNNSVDTGKALLAIIHYYFHKYLRGGIFYCIHREYIFITSNCWWITHLFFLFFVSHRFW